MKVTLSYLAIASAISVASAASCTSDNAAPWPYTAETDGGGTPGDCNGDATCLALQAEGECNALSLLDDEDTETICAKARRLSRKHKRAVDLDCTGNEQCLFFTDNSLLCLDESTGEYHDDVGGSGNAMSGVYTAPSGEVQTVTGTAADDTADPTPTPTAGGSSSDDGSDDSSTMVTRTAGSGGQTTATPAAGSGSGSGSASQTSSAAGATNAAMLAAAAMPLLAAIL